MAGLTHGAASQKRTGQHHDVQKELARTRKELEAKNKDLEAKNKVHPVAGVAISIG
jgi:hypothetical protein